MAATSVAELTSGPEWSCEIKLDGYRVLALKNGDDVRPLSRKNKDLTRDFCRSPGPSAGRERPPAASTARSWRWTMTGSRDSRSSSIEQEAALSRYAERRAILSSDGGEDLAKIGSRRIGPRNE
jgi:hypothetical protein